MKEQIEVNFYPLRAGSLAGTNLKEVKENARIVYKKIASSTKRKPYVRSAYFNKQRVFLHYFWSHLYQKSPKERMERLRYFKAAIELIRNSQNKPISKINPNKNSETVHRFAGITRNKQLFAVQIKEHRKTGKKYFMSCFPFEFK